MRARSAAERKRRILVAQRSQKRRSLFDAQDQIDRQRDELIAQIEGKLAQETVLRWLFTVRWALQ